MKMAKTIKNIRRALMANKIRFIALSIIIAVGVVSWNAMVIAFLQLDATYNRAFDEHNMASFTMQTANPSGTGSDAWIDYANLTKYLNEYKERESRVLNFELRIVYDNVFHIRGNRQNGRIIAFNTTDELGNLRKQPDVNGYNILEGRQLENYDTYLNVCFVEGHLAKYWKLEENEFLSVGENEVTFQILGSVASPEYLMNMGDFSDFLPSPRRFGVIFMPLKAAEKLLDVEGKVNEISILLDHSESIKTRKLIANDLRNFLENEKGLKLSEPVDLDNQVAYWFLRLDMEEARELAFVLPILILLMAMFGLYILLGRMVVAERKDIGVAQALGYSRRSIIIQYVGISTSVAILGTILGTILGILLAREFAPLYVDMVTLLFKPVVTIDPLVLLVGIILGLLTGFFGGYLPVRNSIQALPAESLRFDPSLHITSGKIPLFERLLKKFRINLRTSGFKLPFRNFFRSKRRTFSSITGVIISVSLISMGFGMVDSMNSSISVQYEVYEDWNLKIDYAGIVTNTSDVLGELTKIEEVSAASAQVVSGTTAFSENRGTELQLIGLKKNNDYLGHIFEFTSGEWDPNGVVLSLPIAQKLNVGVDDNVLLEVANLTYFETLDPLRAHFEMVNVSFRVSGIMDEFNGLVAYIGLERLVEISNFPPQSASSIVLKIDNPTQERLNNVREEIWETLDFNIRNISTRSEQGGDLLGLLDLLYGLMYILTLFAVLLAIVMVYNTVYINLQEQEREIATLLTIGTPGRKIVINTTIEQTIMTILGTIIGLIFGYALLYFMFYIVIDMEFFRIKIFISNEIALISFFMTWIGVLMAEFFPLRRILNLNLAEATKERVV